MASKPKPWRLVRTFQNNQDLEDWLNKNYEYNIITSDLNTEYGWTVVLQKQAPK